MATLFEKPSGNNSAWGIAFYDEKNRRKIISIPQKKYSRKTAEQLREAVEALVYNLINKIPLPNKRIERWILDAGPEIQKKLAAVGLIEQLESHTCKELWDTFLKAKRSKVKSSTVDTYLASQRRFFEVFGENEFIENLDADRFERFKAKLSGKLAEATVSGTLTKITAVFNWAVKKKWIQKNPLAGIPRGSFVNTENDRFITADEYRHLLRYCPCLEWRVILALARYGGLRCPSEILRLRWGDINWAEESIMVMSPKTEHHEGKARRVIPLFPEVKEELTELYFRDESEGMEFVINRYRNSNTNLGTQFARIVRKAGMLEIKRPFDNMRMTRSNEVREKFGEFCESNWIGHSRKVGVKHYYKVLPKEIKEAAAWITSPEASTPNAPTRPTHPSKQANREKQIELGKRLSSTESEAFDTTEE